MMSNDGRRSRGRRSRLVLWCWPCWPPTHHRQSRERLSDRQRPGQPVGVAATRVVFTNTKRGVATSIVATCTTGCGTTATAWSVSTAVLPAATYTVVGTSSDVASNAGPASPAFTLNVRK